MKATPAQIGKARKKLQDCRHAETVASEREIVARRRIRETADKYIQCKERGKPENMSEASYISRKRKLHADWERAKTRGDAIYWKFRSASDKRKEAEKQYDRLMNK